MKEEEKEEKERDKRGIEGINNEWMTHINSISSWSEFVCLFVFIYSLFVFTFIFNSFYIYIVSDDYTPAGLTFLTCN